MRICDSETNGLPFYATRMWINVSYDRGKKLWGISFDDEVGLGDYTEEVEKSVGGADFVMFPSHTEHFELLEREGVCYHSYFQFDRLVIRKLINKDWNPASEDDTYILSQVYNPDRGLHGIDAWADRLGDKKPVWNKWDVWDVAMIDRCISDTRIGTSVWEALEVERKEWEDLGESWEEATSIEYAIAKLQGEQELHGVLLDEPKATLLWEEINTEITAIDETLLKQMPLRVIRHPEVGYEKAPFTEGGELRANVVKWFEER